MNAITTVNLRATDGTSFTFTAGPAMAERVEFMVSDDEGDIGIGAFERTDITAASIREELDGLGIEVPEEQITEVLVAMLKVTL